MLSLLGIATAYYLYVVAPQTTERLRARAHAVYAFLVHKWYFDELYDALVYRPLIAIGRFANAVLERVVVQGIVAGTVGAVRGVGDGRARRPVGLRARLRAAGGGRLRRPGPLLPDRQLMISRPSSRSLVDPEGPR